LHDFLIGRKTLRSLPWNFKGVSPSEMESTREKRGTSKNKNPLYNPLSLAGLSYWKENSQKSLRNFRRFFLPI
jgi:hypothetical protein